MRLHSSPPRRPRGSVKLGASAVAGRRHVSAGELGQDAALARQRRGVAIAVVADGAGSASHGGEGAEIVTLSTIKMLSGRYKWVLGDMDPAGIARRYLGTVLRDLRRAAVMDGVALTSMATTVSFAALSRTHLVLCQLGDSPIVLERADGSLVVAGPAKGGGAHNETEFVTSGAAGSSIWAACLPAAEYRGAMVMSDGVAEALVSHRGNAPARACASILAQVRGAHQKAACRWLTRELLDGPIREKSVDDLGVAVLAWGRREGP